MLLARLAWRNVWRNGRRTTITLLALSLGVFAVVSIHSFRESANEEMFRGITRGLVGHIQIHGRGYQDSPDMTTVVADPAAVEATVARVLPGARTERRVTGAGLAGSGDRSSPVMVLGVDAASPSLQDVLTLKQGRGLSAAPAHEAVLGRALADDLGIGPGGELVLVGQAADGSLANDRFTVVGTADAGSAEADATAVFLQLDDARGFFALGGAVHQVVVRLPYQKEDLSSEVVRLRAALDSLEVLSWTEMLPELESVVASKRKNQRAVDAIVFLIVALGVLNTMSMSTFERTREFGVMASLGTRRGRILRLVLLEALLQGLLGLGAGVLAAFLLLHAIGTVSFAGLGAGMDVVGARLPDSVRLSVLPASVASAAVVALLTVLAGGLIPALRASRMKPVEATRYV